MCLRVCSVRDKTQGLETLGKHSTAVFSPESNILSFITVKDIMQIIIYGSLSSVGSYSIDGDAWKTDTVHKGQKTLALLTL